MLSLAERSGASLRTPKLYGEQFSGIAIALLGFAPGAE